MRRISTTATAPDAICYDLLHVSPAGVNRTCTTASSQRTRAPHVDAAHTELSKFIHDGRALWSALVAILRWVKRFLTRWWDGHNVLPTGWLPVQPQQAGQAHREPLHIATEMSLRFSVHLTMALIISTFTGKMALNLRYVHTCTSRLLATPASSAKGSAMAAPGIKSTSP